MTIEQQRRAFKLFEELRELQKEGVLDVSMAWGPTTFPQLIIAGSWAEGFDQEYERLTDKERAIRGTSVYSWNPFFERANTEWLKTLENHEYFEQMSKMFSALTKVVTKNAALLDKFAPYEGKKLDGEAIINLLAGFIEDASGTAQLNAQAEEAGILKQRAKKLEKLLGVAREATANLFEALVPLTELPTETPD